MVSFALYCMLFGVLIFSPETETAAAQFLVTPSNPSYAVEGQNLSLVWTYTLDGSLGVVQFSKVTEHETDVIGVRFGLGKINIRQKYDQAQFRVQATSTKAELMILAVQRSDQATYQLNLISRKPTSITQNVKVIVQSPPRNITTSNDQTITAPAELTLKCSADGKPTPTIFWTRLSDNTYVSMPLNVTGGKNEESYRCTAYNGIGNPLSKVVKTTIHFPPKVTLAQKVFVTREQNVSLICEVEGNPTPTISWSPCDAGNLVCDERYLNISKVQSARANYTCTAKNSLGNDSATTILLFGGKNVYVRLSINGTCDRTALVWKVLQEELDKVFAKTTSYSGAGLVGARCGSLIFDVVFKFSTVVAEDETLSRIQNAAANGKLGELSVNVPYNSDIGIPSVEQT